MTNGSEQKTVNAPALVKFGPCRVIGARCVGKDSQEFTALWERDFLPRLGEIMPLAGAQGLFGLCRCLPGASDGSFEYIAAMAVSDDAPIPDSMVEAHIAAADYVIFPVNGLDAVMDAWGRLGPWLDEHPEWEGYCTPAGCDCLTHPSFEYYPPTFGEDGKLSVYMPIRKK